MKGKGTLEEELEKLKDGRGKMAERIGTEKQTKGGEKDRRKRKRSRRRRRRGTEGKSQPRKMRQE